MEEIIGHRSTLLFLLTMAYICFRLSFYGKRNIDIYAFRISGGFLIIVFLSYLLRNILPGVEIIGIVIVVAMVLMVEVVMTGPDFKMKIPEDKKGALIKEIVIISVVTFLAMWVWQRVSP